MTGSRLSRRALLQRTACAAVTSALPFAAAGAAPPLHEIAAQRGIVFGTYVYADLIDNSPEDFALAAREAALITTEFHWAGIAPTPTHTDFVKLDKLWNWTRAHELKLRGHTLLWGEAAPAWFAVLPDRAAAIRAVERHIAELCGHFRGRLQSWDVVNEAIKIGDGRDDRLRRSVFIDKIGPEFLDLAFNAARADDPKTPLVLNEFGLELDIPEHREKRRVLLGLVDGFRKRGTPIDAIGLQSHLSLETMARFDEKVFSAFLDELAARGLAIMVTELDVIDRGAPADIAQRDAQVAAAYRRYLDVTLANKAINTVIVWGLTDRHSWIDWEHPTTKRADGLHPRPLLFDENYRPKPAYAAVADAFRAAPRR